MATATTFNCAGIPEPARVAQEYQIFPMTDFVTTIQMLEIAILFHLVAEYGTLRIKKLSIKI